MKQHLLIVGLALCGCFPMVAQPSGNKAPLSGIPKGNYQISVENGDTIYRYLPVAAALLPPSDRQPVAKTSAANKAAAYRSGYMDLSQIPTSYAIDNTKEIGEIAISQNSATGALGYTVPIELYQAPNGFNPTVQLAYNSMGGNGVAGYGWQIGGLSAITITNRNRYYDYFPAPATATVPGAFMLDGMRLIDQQTGDNTSRQYQSEQGNIKALVYYTGSNIAKYFKVYYPNGSVATYGYESNNDAKTVYPLTKMTDILGNVITYSYNERNNLYYISEINYGGKASGGCAKVVFAYETRDDATPAYVAGLGITQDRRLKEVKSYFGGQLLRTYSLTYTNAASSLLKQVDCYANGKSLNPLLFYYGENNRISRYETGSILLTTYFNNTVSNLNLSKGKFTLNSSADGLIEYPGYDTYGIIATLNKGGRPVAYQYGSTYSATQKLLVYDLAYSMSTPVELTAGDGFLLLTAMDVDGDGKDELVQVNSPNFPSGSQAAPYETVTYSVYDMVHSLGSTRAQLRYSFNCQYGGTVEWSGLHSPSCKKMLVGDFLGTGKQTILTITCNQNIKGESVQSHATLVDFDSKGKSTVYDRDCFSLSASDRLFVMDFDGDGKADLCRISSSGTQIYTFNMNGGPDLIASYSGLTTATFTVNGVDREMLLGDVNGDGKTDIILSPPKSFTVPQNCVYDAYRNEDVCTDAYYVDSGTTWNVYYSTASASGFVSQSLNLVKYDTDINTRFILQDMNGDGKTDLVVNSNNVISFYPSVNGKIGSTPDPQTVTVGDGARFTTGNVMTAWQMSQLFSIDNYKLTFITYSGNLRRDQLLTGAVTGTGIVNRHQYGDIINKGSYGDNTYTIGSACSYPYRNLSGSLYLLASSDSYLSGNQLSGATYSYTRGMIDVRGRGFMGFETVSAYDTMRGTTATQTFDPVNYGVLKSIDSPTLSASYNYNISPGWGNGVLITLKDKSETNKLTGKTVASSYTYDPYGNPTREIADYGDGLKVTTDNLYSNFYLYPSDLGSNKLYKLGELYRQTVTDLRDGQTSTAMKYIPVFDNNTRLPIVVTTSRDNNPVSETVYTYQNGLITKESVKNYQAATRLETSYGYNIIGQLLNKVDPLGLRVDYDYDGKGQVIHTGDHRHNITAYEYDDWGRKVKTALPDGTTETLTLRWVSTGSPSGGQGTSAGVLTNGNNDLRLSSPLSQGGSITAGNSITLTPGFSYDASSGGSLRLSIDRNFSVSVPASAGGGTGGQYTYVAITARTGAPTTQSYIDALGHEVRSGAMRFDGNYLYTDKMYDSYDRLQKTSLPFKGSTPSLWNTCTYDAYDRLLNLSYASGKTDSYAYGGLSVTSTIDGVTKTTTKDATGKVVSISDPAGTITYNLRPDGQPSSIVAPGGITTGFEYDGYGRQTKLIDPSAGTRTFAYDAAGNLSSEIDAAGKETRTTYDGYNRAVQKEIVGELTTTYTYNADGQLAAVSSSNATGQNYTYDGLMRPVTETESVPDGRWLQKSYTYANGTTTSIGYISQNGAIATENYLYSNGCLTEIKLNNGASVWKLTRENDMGMATGATTGSLTRSYGYDAYGLPTARTVKLGAATLQDFGYSFDPATGNLNGRKDNTRGLQESFSYDGLNRLKTFGGVTMIYDDKGNITGHSAVGQFVYARTDKPYAVTGVTPYGTAIPLRNQDIVYNGMQRPATIAENGYLATFTYDAGGDRVKMTLAKDNTTQLTRYYIGGQYEADSETGVERLYLGGDAYSAASVYVKEGGNRNIYYICRDYLGSITHIVNAAGSLTQELSYDPWGRLRDPNTLIAYTPDTEPVLFLSRGYTGHEHLTQFGLINMNARLYDAALGRFLSPDPYVQAPDFSQNFNRYSYCVNNPLIFVDCNGYTWISHFGYWVGQNWKPIVTIAATVVVVGVVTVATAGMGTLAAAAVVGAAGGFTGGAVGTWVNGGSFLQGVGSGLINGAIGAVAGMAGGAVAGWASKNIGGFALNSLQISGKSAIGGFISGAIGGAFSGAVGGFITGLALTGDLDKAWGMASQGAIYGGIAGAALGGYKGYKDAKALGRNPWTGKISNTQTTNYNLPVGRSGNPLDARGTNTPTEVNGRLYSGHALDQMQGRGIVPSAVEDVIAHPTNVNVGNQPNTVVFSNGQVKVILNIDGNVITVIPQ